MSDCVDIEVCAGPGGWGQGLRRLGVHAIGVEFGRDATATARAAGHLRVLADMTQVDPLALVDSLTVARIRDGDHLDAPLGKGGETTGAHPVLRVAHSKSRRLPVRLFIGSPPCKGFTLAGKGLGRLDSELLIRAIADLDRPERFPIGLEYLRGKMNDARSILVLEPLRYIVTLMPERIALEQVIAVLPIWEAYADVLRRLGYSVRTGVLDSERYGVPQARRRAILVARRDGVAAALPTPTHSRYHRHAPAQLDAGVEKWTSMATALGADWVPEPANGEPEIPTWPMERPSPTIVGTFSPDVVAMPAWRRPGDGPRQKAKGSVRITLPQASILQTFPADYPWQGSKSSQWQQVGDAVPPLLAHRIVKELLS